MCHCAINVGNSCFLFIKVGVTFVVSSRARHFATEIFPTTTSCRSFHPTFSQVYVSGCLFHAAVPRYENLSRKADIKEGEKKKHILQTLAILELYSKLK